MTRPEGCVTLVISRGHSNHDAIGSHMTLSGRTPAKLRPIMDEPDAGLARGALFERV